MTSDAPTASAARSRVPDTFLILLVLLAGAWIATALIAPGRFDLAPAEGGTARIDPESFRAEPGPDPAPLFAGGGDRPGFIDALFSGLVSGGPNAAAVGLMAFLLIVGGAFGVILRTGAVERGLTALVSARRRPGEWMIGGLFLAFSLAGAVFGMGEEAIVLTLIVTPALVRAGYDSLTAVCACYAATQVGFATSWMNPFSVVVAQSIAGLPALSGLGFRVAMWAMFTALAASLLMLYARRVRLRPERSPAWTRDAGWRAEAQAAERAARDAAQSGAARFSLGDGLVIGVLALGVAWVAWGVGARGYYLPEIAAQFFAVGLAAGVIGRVFRLNGVDGNDLAAAFRDGAANLLPAALVVAAAKGIVVLLGGDDPTEPSLFNTLLNAAAELTGALPAWATAGGMFASQSVINLFVVSGSGQAALTMPLMAPLADLTGVTRQTAVLAFQLGDGLTNLIAPASAALMGSLAAARLDWVTWARFIWRPLLLLMLLALVVVLTAQAIGYA